eukprot:12314704-Alexandrium_andersonii.AAC.1
MSGPLWPSQLHEREDFDSDLLHAVGEAHLEHLSHSIVGDVIRGPAPRDQQPEGPVVCERSPGEPN